MHNTFTKFDVLGSVLTELSHHAVSLHVNKRDDGSRFYTVYLHEVLDCSQGVGDTASEALEDALWKAAQKDAARIEEASAVHLVTTESHLDMGAAA